jgi:hypothetical protein
MNRLIFARQVRAMDVLATLVRWLSQFIVGAAIVGLLALILRGH